MPLSQMNSGRSLVCLLVVMLALVAGLGGGFWGAIFFAGIEPAPFLSGNEAAEPASNSADAKNTPSELEKLPAGRWQFFRDDVTDTRLREEHQRLREEILSVGYMAGSMPAPAETGVTVHEPALAYAGLNLYSSGHAPEACLTNMNGEVLHAWRRDFRDVWPEREANVVRGDMYWRRLYLYPNGDLLAIYEGLGLVKLDKDSRVIWAYPGLAHHDLVVTDEGFIHVLVGEHNLVHRVNADEEVLEDFIVTLDANGQEVAKLSILECFENSLHRLLLERMPNYSELFHTNTLELLDGTLSQRSSAFAKGNFLISIWTFDAIAVIDPVKKEVVWSLCGMWRKQHQPTVLENGHLLLFDNLGYYERSQVIEFDPFSQEVAWVYRGDPPEQFLSYTCGSCQRLPNGNTLITESDNGRAFEVTPDKKTVWEFVNPHRAGDNNELIATLFEMVRLWPDFPVDWIGKTSKSSPSPSQ